MSTKIDKTAFGRAMTAALDGPEREHIKFRNHDFQVRQISKTSNGNGTHVQGHMFHQVNNFFDDKVLYSFDVVNGRTDNLEIRFQKGLDKFGDLVKKAIDVASKAVQVVAAVSGGGNEKADGTPGTGKIPRTEPANGTEDLLKDDGWKAEARFLIANIAFRVPLNA